MTPQKFEFTVSYPVMKLILPEQKIIFNEQLNKIWDNLQNKHINSIIEKNLEFSEFYITNSALFGYVINDDLSELDFIFDHNEISKFNIYTELWESFKAVSALFHQEVLSLWDTIPEVEYKFHQK